MILKGTYQKQNTYSSQMDMKDQHRIHSKIFHLGRFTQDEHRHKKYFYKQNLIVHKTILFML